MPLSAVAAEVFAGVALHDIDVGLTSCCSENGVDVQAGWRSRPIASVLAGSLRAQVSGAVNTAGGVGFGAVGVTLRFDLPRRIYVAPGLGIAVQTGSDAQFQRRENKLYLGSRVVFAPEITVGWRIADRAAIELAYMHLSHGRLAGPQNPGLDMIGLRVVFGR